MNQDKQYTPNMKYHPILYSTPMVQAVIQDRKLLTRRLTGLDKVNEDPDKVEFVGFQEFPDGSLRAIFQHADSDEPGSVKCPYGKPGDVLWVRETWARFAGMDEVNPIIYKADGCWSAEGVSGPVHVEGNKWKPSIFMPKSACRIFLEITDIRVERLQGISDDDAMAEGINVQFFHDRGISLPESLEEFWAGGYYQRGFKILWSSINGEASWNSNPWVWVVSFKRIEKPVDFI